MTGLPPLFLGRSSPLGVFRPWNQPLCSARPLYRALIAHFPAMYSKPLSISVFNWSMACARNPMPESSSEKLGVCDDSDVIDDPTE